VADDTGEANEWSSWIEAVQRAVLTKRDWKALLQHVCHVDVLKCQGCGGRMRSIAVIDRIPRHIGEDAQETRFARTWGA